MSKDYTKRYALEAKLGKDKKIFKMLKMIQHDVGYRRHGGMINGYRLIFKYDTTNYAHEGVLDVSTDDALISAYDLKCHIKQQLLPEITNDEKGNRAKQQAKKFLHGKLKVLFSSKELDHIVAECDIEDSLDTLESNIRDEVNSSLRNFSTHDENMKVRDYLKHAYRVASNLPDDTLLITDTQRKYWLKKPARIPLERFQSFYRGLPKSQINDLYKNQEFMYKNSVHFHKATPKDMNKIVKGCLDFVLP